MSLNSSIEWTDATWNPLRGTRGRHHCVRISPGCTHCYAATMNQRFKGPDYVVNADTPRLDDLALIAPLQWRKPRRVFVCSMTDLFLEAHPFEWIDAVFAVMALARRHTFQVLTKRPVRMSQYLVSRSMSSRYWVRATPFGFDLPPLVQVPLPNVWLGVSVESQQYLERIDSLKDTPAAVRFVSFEPLLEHLGAVLLDRMDWAIIGGESGPQARRCSAQWVRSLVTQCRRQGVAPFVKQLGANVIDRNDAGFDGCDATAWPDHFYLEDRIEHDINGYREEYQGADVRVRLRDRKGSDPAEWPEDLRVRQYPEVASV